MTVYLSSETQNICKVTNELINLWDNTTRPSKSSKFRKYKAKNITEPHSRFYPISTSQEVINAEVKNSTTMNQKLKYKKNKKTQ